MLLAAIELAAASSMADVGDLLRQNSIVPVEPPTGAADFTLPMLAGGSGSLSDFQGQWVVLTFWASWCGPCRMEMPTLERLHQQRSESGLAVIGVSLDSSRDLADSFASELQVSFPQFWDEAGRVGTDYRATAIPLTYLIDPAGRVVGTSRGARDWSALEPMLDRLLAPEPVEIASSGYSQDGPLELPAVLDPPTAEISLVESSQRVGEAFHLDIRMRWVGTLEEYLPQPPKVRLPEGVSIENTVASTDSRDSGSVVSYRITLKADRPGNFALDPVELRYIPSSTGSPVVSLVDGPTVEVLASGLSTLKPRSVALLGGALILLAVGALLYARRPSTPETGTNRELEWYRALRARFDACRALRLEGRGGEVALGLAELELELAGEDEVERRRLQELIESLRFGGQVPPSSELDRAQRNIERQIEELRPDPDQQVRSRLRMTDRTS